MSAPARDRNRRYLVTVGPLGLPDEPQDVHLAVSSWNTRWTGWVHGQAICGRTTAQGELDDGATVTCEDCENLRPDYERILGGDPPELTAAEARTEVDRLGLALYRAQDALAFVGECCDIADREGRPITTAQVREWLKGAQCARQAGLVVEVPDTPA
ncbi:MAG: hypothetical protein HOW97_02305 [Catenulispora sp.]|nr:hypothetical protein [Catenulispora sp.]